MKIMKNKIALAVIAMLASGNVFAQEAEAAQGGLSEPLLWIIYFVVALLFLVTYLLYKVTVSLKKYTKGAYETDEQKMYDSRSTWEKIFQVKPVGTDKDTIINEAHDGIYELDNPPPPWFMFLFYGTVLFALIYFVRYSVTGSGPTQEEEYLAEMEVVEGEKSASLESEGASVDENSVVALTDASAIDAGKKIYVQNCKVCHADGGAGSVGPNLTDKFWKHGGGAKNIFKAVKYGIVEKGMTAWQDNLTPEMMQQVTSYIISLEGTNPANAKGPEGDEWIPTEGEDETATEEDAEAATYALTEASDIDAGKKIYVQNCKVCHGKGGAGTVGPNLTDEFWKHGGGAENVHNVIKEGVLDKGMTAWGENLTPEQLQQVTGYVLSLEGTNPEGAKAAEGEKWAPAD